MIIREQFTIKTDKKVELINITSKINEVIQKHGVSDALLNISTKHTTTSIIINEDENGLKKDIINFYEKMVPIEQQYNHDKIDNNARSHLKSILSTPNQTVPVTDGKISLGTWQSIFFLEFDGPRQNRQIIITIIK